MLSEARALERSPALSGATRLRLGAVAGLGALPNWKREADFLFLQVGFSVEPLLRWVEQVRPEVPVYAGVIVLASSSMARNLARDDHRTSRSRLISPSSWMATLAPASRPPATCCGRSGDRRLPGGSPYSCLLLPAGGGEARADAGPSATGDGCAGAQRAGRTQGPEWAAALCSPEPALTTDRWPLSCAR